MQPARLTGTFGVILVVIGLAAYGLAAMFKSDGSPHITTAIPAMLGALLLLCAAAAVIPKFRMHAMHVAALLALIGALSLPMGIMGIAKWIDGSGDPARRAAGPVQVLMGAPSLVLLVLLFKSFIAARRERKAAGAPTSPKPSEEPEQS